jgi:hypothetical protein
MFVATRVRERREAFVFFVDMRCFKKNGHTDESEDRLAQGLREAFSALAPICVKDANRHDPYGIVR